MSRPVPAEATDDGRLHIDATIDAEVSIRCSRVEDLDEALPPGDFRRRSRSTP